MPRYTVAWGTQEKTVYAENEAEAWNEFAKGNDYPTRSPQHFARTVTEVDENEVDNAEFSGN